VRSLLALDLSDRVIETWDELCDALHEPCGLPSWFGRNLDAWSDTIHTGNISDVLDRHFLRVTVRRAGDCQLSGDRRHPGRLPDC
jgi:Barstar (barnase inhibitor)